MSGRPMSRTIRSSVVQRRRADGGLAVGRLVDVEALLDEQGADEHPVLGCVVDDEGARVRWCRAWSPRVIGRSRQKLHGVELLACS